jgi:hypothetical protein
MYMPDLEELVEQTLEEDNIPAVDAAVGVAEVVVAGLEDRTLGLSKVQVVQQRIDDWQ